MASETTRRPARGAGGEAVSEDELQAIEELWRQEPKTGWPDLLVDVVPELVAEVRRLRKLVADAETVGCKCGAYPEPSGCPWCPGEQRHGSEAIDHAADCPAFTPGGRVR